MVVSPPCESWQTTHETEAASIDPCRAFAERCLRLLLLLKICWIITIIIVAMFIIIITYIYIYMYMYIPSIGSDVPGCVRAESDT